MSSNILFLLQAIKAPVSDHFRLIVDKLIEAATNQKSQLAVIHDRWQDEQIKRLETKVEKLEEPLEMSLRSTTEG